MSEALWERVGGGMGGRRGLEEGVKRREMEGDRETGRWGAGGMVRGREGVRDLTRRMLVAAASLQAAAGLPYPSRHPISLPATGSRARTSNRQTSAAMPRLSLSDS